MRNFVAVLCFLGATPLWADSIRLQSGGTLEGVILKRDEDGVVIRLKYATVTIGSFDIASVDSTAAAPVAGARLAGWERCFQGLAARPWGPDLRQQSAPLIDSGTYKNVPYTLHTSGQYQVALYGDPDRPAAIEIGISGALRGNAGARKECADLLASLLIRSGDAEALRSLPMDSGKKESSGLLLETTDEPDSRGRETWWLSASDPAALDSSRVSDRDVAKLATPEPAIPPTNPTLVQPSAGKGERQEVITPFGTEPHDPPKHRKTYGGGAWGRHVRWNHGHVTMSRG